jgi:hypothetical protein
VSKRGRHRRSPSPKVVVWGFSLTSYRLALMGALVLFVLGAVILLR